MAKRKQKKTPAKKKKTVSRRLKKPKARRMKAKRIKIELDAEDHRALREKDGTDLSSGHILEIHVDQLIFESPVAAPALNQADDETKGRNRDLELKVTELSRKNQELENALERHLVAMSHAAERLEMARNASNDAKSDEERRAAWASKVEAYEQWLLALSDSAGDCTFDVRCEKCHNIFKAQDKTLLDALRSLGFRG